MMPTLPWRLALALAMAPAAACADDVSFEKDLLPTLNSLCVMCHLPGAELGGLGLYPDAWLSMVGVASKQSPLKLVEPGAPDKSYLYLKLIARHEAAGGTGLPMPPTQPLDAAQLELVRRWIEQGAKRN